MTPISSNDAPSFSPKDKAVRRDPSISERLNRSVTTASPELEKAFGGPAYLVDNNPRNAGNVSRMLSNAQFIADATNSNGGISADLYSLDAFPKGSPGYMVGGTEDSRTKRAFPTQLVDVGAKDPKLTAHDVIGTRDNILPAAFSFRGGTGARQPVYGTWREEDLGRVDVDFSTRFDDYHKAGDMTMSRKEYAMFDHGAEKAITNEQIRRERGLPVKEKDTVKKDPKQEVTYRSAR